MRKFRFSDEQIVAILKELEDENRRLKPQVGVDNKIPTLCIADRCGQCEIAVDGRDVHVPNIEGPGWRDHHIVHIQTHRRAVFSGVQEQPNFPSRLKPS